MRVNSEIFVSNGVVDIKGLSGLFGDNNTKINALWGISQLLYRLFGQAVKIEGDNHTTCFVKKSDYIYKLSSEKVKELHHSSVSEKHILSEEYINRLIDIARFRSDIARFRSSDESSPPKPVIPEQPKLADECDTLDDRDELMKPADHGPVPQIFDANREPLYEDDLEAEPAANYMGTSSEDISEDEEAGPPPDLQFHEPTEKIPELFDSEIGKPVKEPEVLEIRG